MMSHEEFFICMEVKNDTISNGEDINATKQ